MSRIISFSLLLFQFLLANELVNLISTGSALGATDYGALQIKVTGIVSSITNAPYDPHLFYTDSNFQSLTEPPLKVELYNAQFEQLGDSEVMSEAFDSKTIYLYPETKVNIGDSIEVNGYYAILVINGSNTYARLKGITKTLSQGNTVQIFKKNPFQQNEKLKFKVDGKPIYHQNNNIQDHHLPQLKNPQ